MGWNRAGWGNDWGAGTAFSSVTFKDDIPLYLGNDKDAALEWNTSQTQDAMMIALSGSNSLIVGTKANIITSNRDLIRGADTHPSLIITSATSWATAQDQWVAIWHNGTNAVIDSGKGSVVINDQVIAATTIIPDAPNANALGATDAEFLSLYLGEDANSGLFLGLNQDWRLWYDETTLDALILSEGIVHALAIKGSTITDFKALTGVDGNDVFIRTQSALDSDKRGADIRLELGQQHGSGRAGELNIGDLRWFSLGDGLSAADAGFQWDGGNLLTKSAGVVQTTITQVGIGTDGVNWELAPATSTITAGSIDMHHMYLGQMTISAATALTCDNAATLYIANAPVGAAGAGPSVLTNPYAQWTAAGATRLDGTLAVNAAATFTPGTAVAAQTITQANDANGISMDCDSANNYGILMTAKYGMSITQDISGGLGFYVTRNIAEAGSNPLIRFTDEHADVTQNCVEIRSDSSAATTAAASVLRDGHAATATDGIQLYNRTAATDGVRVQMSPRFVLRGQARKTNATAASQIHLWSMDVLPVQGAAATTSAIRLGNSNAGGGYTYPFSLTDTGVLTLTGGAFMGDNVPTMWGNTAAAPDAAMFSDGTALVIGFDTSTDTTLKLNNAAIAAFTAAADTSGTSVFWRGESGGAHTSNDPDGASMNFYLGVKGATGAGADGTFNIWHGTGAANDVLRLSHNATDAVVDAGSGAMIFQIGSAEKFRLTTTSFYPSAANSHSLGLTNREMLNAHFGEDTTTGSVSTSGVYFGLGQEARLRWNKDATNYPAACLILGLEAVGTVAKDCLALSSATITGFSNTVADTAGEDIFLATQTAGTHAAANPRGANLAIELGLGDGTGVQGTLSVNGPTTITPATAAVALALDVAANDVAGMTINTEANNSNAIEVTCKFGYSAIQDTTGGRAYYGIRNLAEAGSFPLMQLIDENSSVTQHCLSVRSDATAVTTAAAQLLRNGIAAVSTDALLMENSTATSGGSTVEMSPRARWHGEAYRSAGGAERQAHDWIAEVLPITAAGADTTSLLKFGHLLKGAGLTYPLQVSNAGLVDILLAGIAPDDTQAVLGDYHVNGSAGVFTGWLHIKIAGTDAYLPYWVNA